MKIRLLVSRSGAEGAFSAGDEIEVSGAEGKRMIEAGQAEPVRAAARETASRSGKGEKTTARK